MCHVNEADYNPDTDNVVSNASCTTNGMASVCKVLDDNFDVQYGLMTTTHSYTGDQMILDGRHRDLRRARAGACNIVPTSTGAAKAVAAVLPKYKGKLNGIALRVPTPNVSIVDLVVKVGKKTSGEEVNAALKKAAEGPMKGIINFETQPLVSSDFKQTDYSNSVDAALTMVMGEDLVKVVMWYDNEWGYSQRVIDLTAIVADKLPAGGAAASASKDGMQSFQQLSFNYPSSLENIADTNPTQKKTDIVCTIGPKSWDPEVLVKLMKAGMNVMRCNFSHGDHEEQSMKLDNLRKAYELAPELKGKIEILMDTRGPEIRTGTFAVYNSKKELVRNNDDRNNNTTNNKDDDRNDGSNSDIDRSKNMIVIIIINIVVIQLEEGAEDGAGVHARVQRLLHEGRREQGGHHLLGAA